MMSPLLLACVRPRSTDLVCDHNWKPSGAQIRTSDFSVIAQFGGSALEFHAADLHRDAPVGQLERPVGILLGKYHGAMLLRLNFADQFTDTLDHHRCEAER